MSQRRTSYPLDFAPQSTVLASDGNLWMSTNYFGFIAKMAPTGGPVTKYSVANGVMSEMIAGPDSALWFTDCEQVGDFVGRMALDGTLVKFAVSPCPHSITYGPDGNFWVALGDGWNVTGHEIDRMTTGGVLTRYPSTDQPFNIVSGPDGNLWYTSSTGLNRITTAGVITPYPLAGADNVAIGSDGNLWVTNGTSAVPFSTSTDTFGAALTPTIPLPAGLHLMTAGPDGNLWFVSSTEALTLLLRALTVTPSSLSIPAPGQTGNLAVSETNYKGVWSGSSSNPAIATVAKGSPGTLVVTAHGVSSCTITVNDMSYNTMRIPVTVL